MSMFSMITGRSVIDSGFGFDMGFLLEGGVLPERLTDEATLAVAALLAGTTSISVQPLPVAGNRRCRRIERPTGWGGRPVAQRPPAWPEF